MMPFTRLAGAPVVYGMTISKSSPNQKAGLSFVEFLLNKDKGIKRSVIRNRPQ